MLEAVSTYISNSLLPAINGRCLESLLLQGNKMERKRYLSNRPQVSMVYLSNRPQVSMVYLSNRPQVSMVYKLINHAGCWQNTRRICKPRAAGEWFTNSSSVLPTSQAIYQPITHRKPVVYCFYIIIQKTRDFSVGLPAQ